MASMGAIWGPAALRLLRVAAAKTTNVVRTKIASVAKPLHGQVQYIPIRNGWAGRHPIHPAALLKQQKRWLSRTAGRNIGAALRRFISSESRSAAKPFHRSQLPSSNTSRRVSQFSGRAPFANALRPNLTGGAIPRTAGGYGIGGGARYFSHTPAAPAQVVQNVSQAMRAFFLSGQRLRYDGVGPRGDARYRAVSVLEDDAMHKLASIARSAPGSFIDFQLSPTITALSPLAAAISCASGISGFKAEATSNKPSLNTDGFLDVLSADFGRALQDLTAVFADLRRLSVLGDLPVSLENGNTIRIKFPGVDSATLERICDDIGIERGVLGQDPDFDVSGGVALALKFPFAPESTKTLTSPGGTERSLRGNEMDFDSLSEDSLVREAFAYETPDNPWLSDPESYASVSPPMSSGERCSGDFEGLEGIYRFLEECDRAKGRLD